MHPKSLNNQHGKSQGSVNSEDTDGNCDGYKKYPVNRFSITHFLDTSLKIPKIKRLLFLKHFDNRQPFGVCFPIVTEPQTQWKWKIFLTEKIFCFEWIQIIVMVSGMDGNTNKPQTLRKSNFKFDDQKLPFSIVFSTFQAVFPKGYVETPKV